MHWYEGKSAFLGALSKASFGIISDLDGTLSPIVDIPDNARMTAGNHKTLLELASTGVFVAILSGRSAADLAHRVNIRGAVLIGNHGMEEWREGKAIVAEEALAFRPQIAKVAKELLTIEEEGLRIEDKGVSIALHYRQHKNPDRFGDDHRLTCRNWPKNIS